MLLDILKLLLQKDSRDSFKELIGVLKAKPEWQAGLLTLDERFALTEEAKAGVLVSFIHELLLQRDWTPQRAGVAQFVIQELVDNAFIHGRPPDGASGSVRLNTTLTPYWLSCRVTDCGRGFSLEQALAAQAGDERGLSRVKSATSSLVQDGPFTIEATVRNRPGQIDVAVIDGIAVVHLRGRLGHDAFELDPEFAKVDAELAGIGALVIDLSDALYLSSLALRFLMVLHRDNRAQGRRAAMVVQPGSGIEEILRISGFHRLMPCVGSRAEALDLLRGPSGSS